MSLSRLGLAGAFVILALGVSFLLLSVTDLWEKNFNTVQGASTIRDVIQFNRG